MLFMVVHFDRNRENNVGQKLSEGPTTLHGPSYVRIITVMNCLTENKSLRRRPQKHIPAYLELKYIQRYTSCWKCWTICELQGRRLRVTRGLDKSKNVARVPYTGDTYSALDRQSFQSFITNQEDKSIERLHFRRNSGMIAIYQCQADFRKKLFYKLAQCIEEMAL